MEESGSESLKGSSSSGNISDSDFKRVKLQFVDSYVHSVEFAKTKEAIDKRYAVPEKDKIGILKQQGLTLETAQKDELVARHIISKRALINYWEHHLSKRSLDDAEKLVNARVSQLLKDRAKINPAGNLKLDTKRVLTLKGRQDRLAKNIDLLIGLELTAANNIFYGPSAANESVGGKLGSDRRQHKRTSNIEEVDYADKAESTLDLANDETTQEYFEKNGVKVEVVAAKVEAGKKRDTDLGITKLFLNFTHGHPDRETRYPSDLSEANSEGQSRPNSPEHEVNYNIYKDVYENSSIHKAFGEHISRSLQPPPKDVDNKGNNIIHQTVINGNSDALLILLVQSKKTNMLNHTNHEGLTPLDIANYKKDETMIEYLKDYGAKESKELELEKRESEVELVVTSVEPEKVDDIPAAPAPIIAKPENKIVPQAKASSSPQLRMTQPGFISSNNTMSFPKTTVLDPPYVSPGRASFFTPKRSPALLKTSSKESPSTTDPSLHNNKRENPFTNNTPVIDLTGDEKNSTSVMPRKKLDLSLRKKTTIVSKPKEGNEEKESPNKKTRIEDKKPDNTNPLTYTPSPFGFGNK